MRLTQWLTTRRVAAIAGLGYVVGVSIENMEVLGSPTLSSSLADIRGAYADHAFAVVTSAAGALALLAYTASGLSLDDTYPFWLIALPAGALLAGLRTIDQLQPAGSGAAYLAALALLALAGVAVARRPASG